MGNHGHPGVNGENPLDPSQYAPYLLECESRQPMKNVLSIISLISVAISLPASAVIVAGASGGGNTTNNTTRSQLESERGIAFPAYGNVIRYSDASGIYLGFNAATNDVWVLTARHITTNATAGALVTIDGLTYNRQANGTDGFGLLPGGDLRLVRYRRADLSVPSLPAVALSSTVPTAGTELVMIGFGQNRTQNATTNRNTSDAVPVAVGNGYNWSGTSVERWGTNNIEAEFLNALEATGPVSGTTGTFLVAGYNSIGYMTDFDTPGPGEWLSSNEAQASLGDSGGSALYYSGGQWILSGIFSSVGGPGGQMANTSAFGNFTLVTDVASYSGAIGSSLGTTLIPESASSALLMLSAVALLVRRRRSA
ncbi:MAG: hypothetical protein RLZZ282_575 [Verrucomicrobiota bacterium]